VVNVDVPFEVLRRFSLQYALELNSKDLKEWFVFNLCALTGNKTSWLVTGGALFVLLEGHCTLSILSCRRDSGVLIQTNKEKKCRQGIDYEEKRLELAREIGDPYLDPRFLTTLGWSDTAQ
jgi:hypothetical protein